MTAAQHPLLELGSRYRAVFSAAWQARHELAGPARLADEAAFLPAALSLQDSPVHPAPRRFAYAIMLLFVIALAWTIFGTLDIVAVATGRIVVSDRTKLVQPLERSVVKQILVKDGDRVRAGQPLVELDATAASADRASLQEQVKSAQSDALRARAVLAGMNAGASRPTAVWPPEWRKEDAGVAQAQLEADWSDVSAKLTKFAAEADRRHAEIATVREIIAKLDATLPLARQREADLSNLAQEGYAPGHSAQDKTRERLEMERDLATQRSRLMEAQAGLRESESGRAAYVAETRRALSDREAQAQLKWQQAAQEQTKAAQRQRLTVLTAPVSGVVQQLAIHTSGGVVTEAQALMIVVPEDAQVTAEVMLENKDIGFVNVGQEAEIKLETFPFTRYGTVRAVVARVSADAVNEEKKGALFPVTMALGANEITIDGRQIRLQPGMNLTAEIKTGSRKMMDFFLSPMIRQETESLRER